VNWFHSSLGGLAEVSGINRWSSEEWVDVLQTSTEQEWLGSSKILISAKIIQH